MAQALRVKRPATLVYAPSAGNKNSHWPRSVSKTSCFTAGNWGREFGAALPQRARMSTVSIETSIHQTALLSQLSE